MTECTTNTNHVNEWMIACDSLLYILANDLSKRSIDGSTNMCRLRFEDSNFEEIVRLYEQGRSTDNQMETDDETKDTLNLVLAFEHFQNSFNRLKEFAQQVDSKQTNGTGPSEPPPERIERLEELKKEAREKNQKLKLLIDKLRNLSMHMANMQNVPNISSKSECI